MGMGPHVILAPFGGPRMLVPPPIGHPEMLPPPPMGALGHPEMMPPPPIELQLQKTPTFHNRP